MIRLAFFLLLTLNFTIRIQKLCFDEFYPPFFEKKNKKMEDFERSILQLMSILVRGENKYKINRFAYTSKVYSTLGEKNSFPSMLNILIF